MTREQITEIFHSGLEAVLLLVLGLLEKVAELEKENQALKEKVASLEKDSTNSSKPPSSDGPKKKRGAPKRGSSGRKPGGQKGHVGKTREPAPPEKVKETVDHKPTECDHCHKSFSGTEPTEVAETRQVLEIPQIKPFFIRHLFHQFLCDCGHHTRLPVPDWVMSGTGERLQALMVYLTAEARLARRTVKKVLAELFNVPSSLGGIQNRLENTSEALESTCKELEDALPTQPVQNIDETSYPHNAKLNWLWAFVTSTFVFFTIRASRGSKVLREVLGGAFEGIIICDRFSAYVKFHKDRACGYIQYCWAHLIRDVKGLKYAKACGRKEYFSGLARQHIGALFRLWHAFKRGHLSRETLIERAEPRIAEMRVLWEENLESPFKPVRTLCKGMLGKWDSLFTFIYHEGVEPTNNLAERILRHGVQTRKSSYCTRSEKGQIMLPRFFTVSGTCRLQGRNAFEFFIAAIHAKRHNLPAPSLLVIDKKTCQSEDHDA